MTLSKTREKLAAAFKDAGLPSLFVERAVTGYYSDFAGPLAAPKVTLVYDLERELKISPSMSKDSREKIKALIAAVMNGEHDDSEEDVKAWEQSEEGQSAVKMMLQNYNPPRGS